MKILIILQVVGDLIRFISDFGGVYDVLEISQSFLIVGRLVVVKFCIVRSSYICRGVGFDLGVVSVYVFLCFFYDFFFE